MKKTALSILTHDFLGAVSSSVVAISGNIVFGIIAFSPLGPTYIPMGIMAGFFCSILVCFFSSILGGVAGMISGPRASITLIFAGVLTQLIASGQYNLSDEQSVTLLLGFVFLTILLAGIIQILFGLLHFGRLIKFISYPVIAGFLNGTAILIIATQIWAFLGLDKQDSLLDIFHMLDQIKPYTLILAGSTFLVMLILNRFVKILPGSIIALGLGSLAYHLLIFYGLKENLGPTLGSVTFQLPWPHYAVNFFNMLKQPDILPIVISLLPAAISISVLSSTDSLLTALSIQDITDKRAKTNRELVGQGLGNIAASLFGGLAGGGSLTRSMANVQLGARTRISGILNSIIVAVIIFTLSFVVELIPRAVIAGIVMALAFAIIDRWSLRLLKRFFFNKGFMRIEVIKNLFIVILVVVVTICANLVVAVGLGITISVLLFVYKKSKKSVIRRIYTGSIVHSKKQRDITILELLGKYGSAITVIELDGSIFFGSIDDLEINIDKIADNDTQFIILDMKRVDDIDSTGSRMLEQTTKKLARKDKIFALSYLQPASSQWQFLDDIGFWSRMGKKYVFADTDHALEYFENIILKKYWNIITKKGKIAFAIFKGLKSEEFEVLKSYFKVINYKSGDYVFRQGDKGNTMYIIMKGLADVTIDLPGLVRKKRLQTLSPGTFFGDMALLEGKPRTAHVVARNELICYELDRKAFNTLAKKHPQVTLKLMVNISKTIATRLRHANTTISELEV